MTDDPQEGYQPGSLFMGILTIAIAGLISFLLIYGLAYAAAKGWTAGSR